MEVLDWRKIEVPPRLARCYRALTVLSDSKMFPIAALVPTHDRPKLLSQRSLASIARQTRTPDYLVIIDDSSPAGRPVNQSIADNFRCPGTRVVYLENRRTPGLSGAINTALIWLQAEAPTAWVAMLDDDDAWEPDYLESCARLLTERDLDMVAAGIIYHETGGKTRHLSSPTKLDVNELLVRNPHIQGSNLFVRSEKLLEAGGFDEALVSTTDRDVCIRLADLGSLRYANLTDYLVHHHADDDRPRLSSRGGDAKCAGLSCFYRKYSGRMTVEQQEAFISRSRDLFDCDPTVRPRAPSFEEPPPRGPSNGDYLDLVVGAITSPEVDCVSNLLESLLREMGGRKDVGLKILLLENGGHDRQSRNRLRDVIDRMVGQGLDIELKTLEDQRRDAADGIIDATEKLLSERKSIALSRTMLQQYLYWEAKPRAGAVVWILDDDVTLEGLVHTEDGAISVQDVDYAAAIKELKRAGQSIVLGEVTGDAPLPILSCVRTQLVDLYHNLHQLAALRPGDPYPDRGHENQLARSENADYYYDLSRSGTGHLERPFWYQPSRRGMTAEQVLSEVSSRVAEIFMGAQVFRPVVQSATNDPTFDLNQSMNRGPSTLVFDPQALREFPNAVPKIDGIDTRRSDMAWSILNRFAGRRDVVQSALPVRQERRTGQDLDSAFKTLAQDIHGFAICSAMEAVLRQKQYRGHRASGTGFLSFGQDEIDLAMAIYRQSRDERLAAFEWNFARISGLVRSISRFCCPGAVNASGPWWISSPGHAESSRRLGEFWETLSSVYTPNRLAEFMRQVAEANDASAVEYFLNLHQTVARHRSMVALPVDAIRTEAEARIKDEFGTGPLICLGVGEEGAVFTDGSMVYKYFHYWRPGTRDQKAALLRSLVGRMSAFSTLPDIQQVRRWGEHVAVVYPYERGDRYDGGRLEEIITLLHECRTAGIACRNLHPDNLLVTPSGLKFIDIGADIVPFDEDEFEQMCRRALLTYRFHFRSDLKALMTRSLDEPDLPELAGLDQFRRAVDPRGVRELLHTPLAGMVMEHSPKTVLDYGCGNGELAELLANEFPNVTGYDPDADAMAKCLEHGGSVQYGDSAMLEQLRADTTRFDAVICSRVLCTIADSNELATVMSDLRRLVADEGRVWVAVCNPFYLEVASTELNSRPHQGDHGYHDTFVYQKAVAPHSNVRDEVHRSLTTYRRAFAKAGLRVAAVKELDGADIGELRPASDHLVFELRPVFDAGPSVSLLLKTCHMEWRTIERFVRHQVAQLEEPVKFIEKVVVVDPSPGPFLRQYDMPDADAHREAMDRLLRDGVVDRVLYAPVDPAEIRGTYRKWFGVEALETHSTSGQQLFATLYGFEECGGDYVLQLDSDLLIHRDDVEHDYISELSDVLRDDPNALFVPLSICRSGPLPYTDTGPNGDWRVEVRGCLFDRRRLESVLPVANKLESGRFVMGWHRAFDRFIAGSEFRSYRGGDPRTSFIHVPNERKADPEELLDILAAVGRGYVPDCQLGKVDLQGSVADWAGPKHPEPFVFVICGRNVNPGQFKRCIASLTAQIGSDWGAVVVDDASTNGFGDYAEVLLADYRGRVTIVRNATRKGLLYNTWNAIANYCADPQSVIITLDADDALIGTGVLERLRVEYENGADVTVGSMLRLDKEAVYPADFERPRWWTSNVWQHLRTFRKYLFDAIDPDDLMLDGKWIDIATDWAFMVPVIEMAENPTYIAEPLYLYEPSERKRRTVRAERDSVIARILNKAEYGRLAYRDGGAGA